MSYTRSTAVARVQRGLGFRTDLEDEIIDALQEAQRTLERGKSLPYFLLQEDQTLAVASGSADVSLPTGFIKEKEDEPLRYTDSDGNLIKPEKLPLDIGTARFLSADAGKPIAYVLRKAGITFFPERDTDYSLTWSYYKAADVLTTDITNDWLTYAPEVLVFAAGVIVAADMGASGEKTLQKFQALYKTAWDGMFANMIERELENKPLKMGSRL